MKHNGQFIAVQCLLMTDDDNCKLDFCLCLLLQVVHSRFQDLVPVHLKDEGDPELERPSEEDIEEVHLQRTFLRKLIIAMQLPKTSVCYKTKHV